MHLHRDLQKHYFYDRLGKPMARRMLSDTSAVLCIIQRQELGSMRHVDRIFPFVQKLNMENVYHFSQVSGGANPEDLAAKGLRSDGMVRYQEFVSGKFCSGIPAL